MPMLEETENIYRKHQELCSNLNLDSESANQAWDSYESIRENYTLEGDQLHWLGCALYVACRRVSTPSVGRSEIVVHGNGVNLTRLLRLCNLSLIQFFNKSKKWLNMANMPGEFRTEIERLERNFEVTTYIFKQYQLIFYDMFVNTTDDAPKQPRSRKQRSVPCSSSKIFEFCWTLFIYMKGEKPDISADLVNSYHYLLACCDLMFANAIMSDRRELLKSDFPGLPSDWSSSNYKPPSEPPSVIDVLCQRHHALVLDAKVVKKYSWHEYMRTFVDKRIVRAELPSFIGLLDQEVFDYNLRSINREYETYVLNKGDFDERIFLEEDANVRIGSPTRLIGDDIKEQLNSSRNRISDEGLEKSQTVPDTPYTGRCYLPGRREIPFGATLVTSATYSVSHLRTLLSGRSPNPSQELLEIFQKCEINPSDRIEERLVEYGELFCSQYSTNFSDTTQSLDFAQQRLELARTLYFKLLEDIITEESRKKDTSCSVLLSKDIFHHCLFAICLEIVIFSYNSQHKFPWILNTLNLEPFYFYKIIEPVVSIKDYLSRDLVKHLNSIEEQILQAMAWQSDSPLWEKVAQASIPTCAMCTIPVANATVVQQTQQNDYENQKLDSDSVQPPTDQSTLSSASERFQSPGPTTYSSKRRLLQESPTVGQQKTIRPGQSLLQNQPKFFLCGDKFISVVMPSKTCGATVKSESNIDNNDVNTNDEQQQQPATPRRIQRTDSFALFFRKFYHLASVRMNVLCNDLNIADEELRQKIWTCFEHSIVKQTTLMKDRHLDQILMCAVYVICKVSGPNTDLSFTEIMRCYRLQPQASSHIYRNVFLQPYAITRNRSSVDSNSTSCETNGQQQNNELIYESRGDLIKFYNSIYVLRMKNYALNFSSKSGSNIALSPLPTKPLTASPTRRISDRVYVKPLVRSEVNESPTTVKPLSYCFSRSPAKNLREINNMIITSKSGGKRRILTDDSIDDENDNSTPAKLSGGPLFQRKIDGLFNDRLSQSKEKE